MKVLFAASECVPFAKTGGLADVIGALPVKLKELGADVRVIMPKYKDIPDEFRDAMSHKLYFFVNLGWRRQYCGIEELQYDGITYYFVDNEFYFGRRGIYSNGNEEGERFAFFTRAVLEALPIIGFIPDIMHLNDWQAGMIAALLKIQYSRLQPYKKVKTVFTIHNINYTGVYPWAWINELLGVGDKYYHTDYLEYFGMLSFIKGGIAFADAINTVSPSYAVEIKTPFHGGKMSGFVAANEHKLSGILNGIDYRIYDPSRDRDIKEKFSSVNMSGKAVCKADLRQCMGLDDAGDAPIIGMVTRLTEQKGLELIEAVIEEIMAMNVQVAVLGSGDEKYQSFLAWASWKFKGRLAAHIGYDDLLAKSIYAGSDIFLMPSLTEPCGLAQLIALKYGSVPIVRETGGLKDTIIPYNQYTGEGNGFSFANYNAHEMLSTIENAVDIYYSKREAWASLMKSAMESDYSWGKSAGQYMELYKSLIV
ncbi:MAG: glycogen synthase GlgA [Christensenellales bacterium]|jgi:starch synthase